MNVTDFGKNTFQCEITFRFDCLSPDFFLFTARSFTSKADQQWLVGKDSQDSLLLTAGDGSENRPFFQLKFTANKIALWAGWHTPYDSWVSWRFKSIRDLSSLSDSFPSAFVLQIFTQAGIVIPLANLKASIDETPHLKPVIDFYRKFIPERYLHRSGGYTVFATGDTTKSIETQSVGDVAAQHTTFNFSHRWTAVDPNVPLSENILQHLGEFDELFSKYHENIIKPLLKA